MTASKNSEPVHKVVIEKHLGMRTRDGVTLYADVYRPDASGKFPVLVVRTPYDKGAEMALTEKDYFPQRGYVVVVQDTRGRYSSEGEFVPFVHEALDGYDTIEWAAGLPRSNGVVGMVGQSYLGLVQYFAAPERPPHLKAMSPVSGPVSYFENFAFRRGAFELGWVLAYFASMARDTMMRKGVYERDRAALDKFISYPISRWRRSSSTPACICRCATGASGSRVARHIWPNICNTGPSTPTGRGPICDPNSARWTCRCSMSGRGMTSFSTTL